MKNMVKENIQWICEKFNLEVLGTYKDVDDTTLVIFRHKTKLIVSPIYITSSGETLIKTQECFYELVVQEIGDLF